MIVAKNVIALVLVFVLLASRTASAFYDLPYVTPEHLNAGETMFLNIRGGECDAIVGIPGHPQITQEGNAIRILFWTVHHDDPLFCNHDTGTATYPLGSYLAGTYTLQVDRYDHLSDGQPAVVALGTVSFVVHGVAAPIPAPAVGYHGLAFLVLLVGGAAFLKFVRTHGRRHR